MTFPVVLCLSAVTCQRRSYSTSLTPTVWLLTAQDPLLLDSGEEEEEEEEERGWFTFLFVAQRLTFLHSCLCEYAS